jgi:uncharacterized protein HemX
MIRQQIAVDVPDVVQSLVMRAMIGQKIATNVQDAARLVKTSTPGPMIAKNAPNAAISAAICIN